MEKEQEKVTHGKGVEGHLLSSLVYFQRLKLRETKDHPAIFARYFMSHWTFLRSSKNSIDPETFMTF